MKKLLNWILKLLTILLSIIVVGLLILGFIQIPADDLFSPEDYGAGSSSVRTSSTGLQREFPPINGPSSADAAELGRLLFFDPILSDQNDLSCAHCHHPDLGFADGLRHAIGANGTGAGSDRTGGITLQRSTPSLWNVGFNQLLFWDGRENSLEEQTLVPITREDEMGVKDLDAMVQEIANIPGYRSLFQDAFGSETVTFERIAEALSAFQRSLITDDSAFDFYARGDINSLTPAQRRGLNLFRSAALRCFECHQAPTFASETLRVVGVPSMLADSGAGNNDFKVPTLRNVALTAPYMHNGAFTTLEEVIDFYAEGGGNQHGFENVDPFVLGFEVTEQEKMDLVAFLFALTDESQLPIIPETVPSGLPVIPRLDNPARELIVLSEEVSTGNSASAGAPQTIQVQPGETIQGAVDRARPGDTVEIPYGTYHETVVIDISNFTIRGIPNGDGEYPTLDGKGELTDAIISSGNDFVISHLRILNYLSNGVIVEGVTGVHMHHLWAENTGIYGLYPVQSTDVLVENSVVIGANDAGIYAGQSEDVIIRNNEVYENVLGIEVENTVGAEVYGNHAHDNTLGIFIDLLPNLTSKVSLNTKVYNNLIENNNHVNFARAGTAAASAPSGSGIGLLGADHVEIYDNEIRGNKTAGVGIFHINVAFPADQINIPGTPENIWVHGNIFENNGYDADAFITSMGISGADILWDVSGANNRFDQPGASAFPPLLPTSRWPGFFYNMYWQLLNFLIGML